MKSSRIFASLLAVLFTAALFTQSAMAQVPPPQDPAKEYDRVKGLLDKLETTLDGYIPISVAVTDAWDDRRPFLSQELMAAGDSYLDNAEASAYDASKKFGVAKDALNKAKTALTNMQPDVATLAIMEAETAINNSTFYNQEALLWLVQLDNTGK